MVMAHYTQHKRITIIVGIGIFGISNHYSAGTHEHIFLLANITDNVSAIFFWPLLKNGETRKTFLAATRIYNFEIEFV